jgi:hypothetical protein
MRYLDTFTSYLQEADKKSLYRVLGILFLGALLLIGAEIYFYFTRVNQWQRKFIKLNSLRSEARDLLARYQVVLEQKKRVDDFLTNDKSFKIKEFFSTVVQQLGLIGYVSKSVEVAEPRDMLGSYQEIVLTAGFAGLNMKQVVDLLSAIEANERVYTKELIITKSQRPAMVDITLVIATLQQAVGAGS